MPPRGIAPKLGLKPTTPQKAAGRITEPAVCVPTASGAWPAATAAAEPADEPPGVRPGAAGLRGRRRLHEGELGRRGLAEDQRARRLQPRHDEGVLARHPPGVDRRAVPGRDPRGVDDVLDPDRHPVQRPDRPPGGAVRVKRLRLGPDELRVEPGPGADLGLGSLDARDQRLGRNLGPKRAASDAVAPCRPRRGSAVPRAAGSGLIARRPARAARKRSAGRRRRAPLRRAPRS